MSDRTRIVDFAGESRRLLLCGMLDVFKAVKKTGEPRWISLEAPPGWGKSRLGRELYASIATEQNDPHYWPAQIPGDRKIVHPNPFPHVPASLPDYLWWGISCTARDNIATNALRSDLGQFESHKQYVDDAIRSRTLIRPQIVTKLAAAGRAIRNQARLEATAKLVSEAIGFSTGLGLLTNVAESGLSMYQDHKARQERRGFSGLIDSETDIAEDTTALLQSITDTGFPLVILVEDLHHADNLLIEAIDKFMSSLTHVLIITTAWPEEIDRRPKLSACVALHANRVDRLKYSNKDNQDSNLGEPYPAGASLAELEKDALSKILREYYPKVEPETESRVLAKYTNPWTLQLFCELEIFLQQYPHLSLTADRIDMLPGKVRDLHILHWNQLSDAHKVALGIASFMLAGSDDDDVSEGLKWWDHRLVRRIIPELQIRKLDPMEAVKEVDRSSSAHGWVRELDDHLRAFLEATQTEIAADKGREYLCENVLDPNGIIQSQIASGLEELGEGSDAVYQSRTVLSLYDNGHIDDVQRFAEAIETLLAELHDAPREIDERCRLFDKYVDLTPQKRLQVDAETKESLLYYGASALEEAGKNQLALDTFEELLREQETLLGEEHEYTLETRHSIATQRAEMGHVDIALASLEKLLLDRERIFEDIRHPDILMNRHDIAFWKAYSGRTAEAVDQYRTLVRESEEVLGETARPTLRRKQLLASELSNLGEHDEAMMLAAKLTNQFGDVLGKDDPDTLIARQRQAVILGQSGRTESAALELERIVDDCNEILPITHPKTLSIRHHYAKWLSESRSHESALFEFRSLIRDSEKQHGRRHIDTLGYRRNYATALDRSGDMTQAVEVLADLVDDYSDELGEKHVDTLSTRRHLVVQLTKSTEFGRVLRTVRTLSSDYDEVLGREHRGSLEVKWLLGSCLAHTRQYPEAITILSEVSAEQERLFGRDDSDTMRTATDLATVEGLAAQSGG